MTKHTPGPWALEPCSADHGESTVICVGSFVLARIDSNAWERGAKLKGDEKHDRANARLMTAAPDMLAALERISLAWEDMRATSGWKMADPVTPGETMGSWAEQRLGYAMRDVSSAIAKARGE